MFPSRPLLLSLCCHVCVLLLLLLPLSDGGRVCRPLLVVENGRTRLTKTHLDQMALGVLSLQGEDPDIQYMAIPYCNFSCPRMSLAWRSVVFVIMLPYDDLYFSLRAPSFTHCTSLYVSHDNAGPLFLLGNPTGENKSVTAKVYAYVFYVCVFCRRGQPTNEPTKPPPPARAPKISCNG